ncbi:hypothetical protein SAMN05444266_112141 [Chitinophaga jiangningensis]|uniref:Uncharacterized protein n=1 Tax=Chitinophaga jiangningensis TaxID=1419482 RepID=A0A1M7M985_9BACT|nr:hypothetical protein [Chitinophaga jiangningensis]SHM87314.1 hypothetical protein SAMN05444266_112141 [Chitinophaga jiangningensis]
MTICAALLLATGAQAQQPRYKQHAGRYGGNSGICLFEDGKFLLYGYATAVFGQYLFEKDYLLFYPDKPAVFTVYAHKNPALHDSTRINFVNFQDGRTWVQFNNTKAQRAFNEDANCFDAPFVYQHPGNLKTFTLLAAAPESEQLVSWEYANAKGCNDFIFLYNKPKREYEHFSAHLEQGTLKTDNGQAYTKVTQDESEDGQWKEILEWKRQYFASAAQEADKVLANKHYNTFAPDLKQYTFDNKTALYIANNAEDNEAYFRGNQYKDDRYIRLYEKILPQRESKVSHLSSAPGSIFFTVCGEGSEKSYHYNGFIKYEEDKPDGPLPTTTVPVKVTE